MMHEGKVRDAAAENDVLEIMEDLGVLSPGLQAPWRVLVVDDDGEVHHATRFALSGVEVMGRPVQLHSAYSAAEAEEFLRHEPQVAVVLLDVVMEKDDSGLELIGRIRGALGMEAVRIILRTGQPGQAPEQEVIAHYDIHDYALKNEMTQGRLVAALTTALRTYARLQALEAENARLRDVMSAAGELLSKGDLSAFVRTAMHRLSGHQG